MKKLKAAISKKKGYVEFYCYYLIWNLLNLQIQRQFFIKNQILSLQILFCL